MRRLVVTADDVGLHEGMTRGAIYAHREGIVTACSVAAAGNSVDGAVALLRECPGLDVGVHLMLVEGTPVSAPDRVPSLLAHGAWRGPERPGGRGARFVRDYRAFVARYALGRVSLAEVERELRAQIERVLDTGLRPSHLNAHQHLHLLPAIFDIVLGLARTYRIPYVRIVNDRGMSGAGVVRRAAIAHLSRLGRQARSRASAAGVRTNDATVGVACAGRLDARRLAALLGHVDGVTELVVHPGIDGAAIGRSYPWRYSWDEETSTLSAPDVRTVLEREGILLCGIRGVLA